MDRTALQRIAEVRIREARVLLGKDFYDGAYYLSGYSVECALKACIAKQTKAGDFPDKQFVNKSYTHDLSVLLQLAGLQNELESLDHRVQVNWAVVKDWSEERRYELDVTKQDALDYISACTARKYGVLPWLRRRW